MKKNCNGCKAIIHEYRSGAYGCSLGYSNAVAHSINGIVVRMKPLEECPKPVTNKLYMQTLIKKHEK